MADETPAQRRPADAREDDEGGEQPLGRFGDEDRPQAEPAAGEPPLEHLATGRFGDTTADPDDEAGAGPPGEDGAADPDG